MAATCRRESHSAETLFLLRPRHRQSSPHLRHR